MSGNIDLKLPDSSHVSYVIPGAPDIPSPGPNELAIEWNNADIGAQDELEAVLSDALDSVREQRVVRTFDEMSTLGDMLWDPSCPDGVCG